MGVNHYSHTVFVTTRISTYSHTVFVTTRVSTYTHSLCNYQGFYLHTHTHTHTHTRNKKSSKHNKTIIIIIQYFENGSPCYQTHSHTSPPQLWHHSIWHLLLRLLFTSRFAWEDCYIQRYQSALFEEKTPNEQRCFLCMCCKFNKYFDQMPLC